MQRSDRNSSSLIKNIYASLIQSMKSQFKNSLIISETVYNIKRRIFWRYNLVLFDVINMFSTAVALLQFIAHWKNMKTKNL